MASHGEDPDLRKKWRLTAPSDITPEDEADPSPGDLLIAARADHQHGFPYGAISAGMILMWYGLSTEVPTGWALCDGNNDTPDLRDRFVVGAGGAYSGTPGANSTGGSTSVSTAHTHNLASHTHAQSDHTHGMQGHTHTSDHTHNVDHSHNYTTGVENTQASSGRGYPAANDIGHIHSGSTGTASNPSSGGASVATTGGPSSASTAGSSVGAAATGAPSNNTSGAASAASIDPRPPYYALFYIMKL